MTVGVVGVMVGVVGSRVGVVGSRVCHNLSQLSCDKLFRKWFISIFISSLLGGQETKLGQLVTT